ncbi:MAG: hypothetical protein JSU70_04545 [Phycisphaerales bacterium]|nr:MAG: hypothetical protein JSU70_04545 [Phycisphaerales bacterium]
MNKAQEEALICVILMPAAALVCGALGVGLAYVKAVPLPRLMLEFTLVFALLGCAWLIPFLLRRTRKKKRGTSFDERDETIIKKAALTAYVVLWLYFVAACVIAWWIVGPHGSITVNVMPLTLAGGLAIFGFVHNVAILVQYGRGGKGEKS